MSSELPPSPPPGDAIKKLTEELAKLVQWVAGLVVAKNWFTLLILLAIANFFLFKPSGGIALKVLTIALGNPPAWYETLFWVVEAGLVLGALAIAVRTLPRTAQSKPVKVPDYKAIKGLRPFTQEDAEVFAQLQRQGILRQCLGSVTSPGFRFGILHGVSGCGKTSFLQAGIVPQLSMPNTTHRGIYVRLGGQDPVRAIAIALSGALEIPLEWLLSDPESTSFRGLLDRAFNAAEKPLIVFLDQFEQFFVYYGREEQRQPFVQALTVWYTDPQPLPVSLVVAVRSDLLYQLDELHKALGYALGPQEVFRLEKFTPKESVNVLKAIADLEHLSFDARFITEIAEAELADRDDGRISPVDVQILAWMIEQQPQGELRALDRNAFQKFGGVEGLLQRFLERTLGARMQSNQRQTALKVLLALTDLDRQVRAGVMTVSELKTKLRETVAAEDVAEAVQWLVRGDVRLITPQEREGVIGYELAHERLIPALLRQTQKELTDVDRARQLLDRRVNEWLGNRRDKRYLFGLRELWLIGRQRPYLDWGTKREQKERLIRISRRRVYGAIGGLILVISLVMGGVGWLRFTTSGQLHAMYWQLNSQLASAGATQVAAAAVAFAKNNQWNKAFELTQTYLHPKGSQHSVSQDAAMSRFVKEASDALIKSSISNPDSDKKQRLQRLAEHAQAIQDDRSKSPALSAIATAYAQLKDPVRAAEVLKTAFTSAQAIQDDSSKSYLLSDIATAYAQLKDPARAAEVLKTAFTSAQAIQNGRTKSYLLSDIAVVYAQLKDPARAVGVLKAALTSAQAIQDDRLKSYLLSDIATAAAQLKDPVRAAEVLKAALTSAQAIQDDSSKSLTLSNVATAAAQLKDPAAAEMMKAALTSAQALQNNSSKSSMLLAIAIAYAQLKDPATAAGVLKAALTSAQTLQNNDYKSLTLSDVAIAYTQLKDPAMAAGVLKDTLTSAQTLQDDHFKSSALSAIAIAYTQLKDPATAAGAFKSIFISAQTLQDDDSKSSVLNAIAAASWAFVDDQTQQPSLDAVLDVAWNGKLGDVIRWIVSVYAKQGQWNRALAVLRGYGNATIFSQLLTIQAENTNPALIDGAVVLGITATGNPNSYTLEATIQSPDQSCDRHASWWEVITPDGELLARQVFNTVHQDPQPFTSRLASVKIAADQEVLIRAHFQGYYESDLRRFYRNQVGYTDQVVRGSVKDGFKSVRLSPDFAAWLEHEEPQPGRCVE